MKKRKALWKDTLRSIKSTRNRFISIFIIIALGVGFYAGLQAASPDMKLTGDSYFDQQNLMDIRLISTLGFSEEDIEAVRNIEGVQGVMPSYFTDVINEYEGSQSIVRIHSLDIAKANTGDGNDENYLNRPVLVEGRFPEKSGECVIESGAFGGDNGYKVGSTIILRADSGSLLDTLKTDTYTIVGVVNSPYYISFERGNTSIGNGSVDSFIMIPAEDFVMEAYPELYLSVAGARELSSYAGEYQKTVDKVKDAIDAISDDRETLRYTEILDEAEAALIDARKKVADGEKELSDAQQKLNDARSEIEENEQKLNDQEAEFQKKMQDAWKQINSGKAELTAGEKEFNKQYQTYLEAKALADKEIPAAREQLAQKKQELADGEVQLEEAKQQLEESRKQLETLQKLYNTAKKLLVQAGSNMDKLDPYVDKYGDVSLDKLLEIMEKTYPDEVADLRAFLKEYGISTSVTVADAYQKFKDNYSEILAQAEELQVQLDEANKQLAEGQKQWEEKNQQVIDGKKQLGEAETLLNEKEQQLKDAQAKLEEAKKKLKSSSALLNQKTNELKSAQSQGQAQLGDAKKQLADAKEQLEDSEKEFNEKKTDAEKELDDAREQIADGEKELAELEIPTWYIMDRSAIPGYSGYGENTNRIAAIAKVFPVFFFVVAALVCLTTMTRMVEEDRTQIGTLKALGYGKGKIIRKYLVYAAAAGLGGSIFGLLVGFQLFPMVIVNAYKIMYIFPVKTLTPFHWNYALIGMIAALLCTVLAAVAVCWKEMLSNPAQLMRPKAPKSGKRILLERIPFIWKHLKFTQKVTARNIFRYKQRFLMTVIGIAGCTALLLTGFGLKNAIAGMIDKQFKDISSYDMQIMLNDGITQENKEEKLDFILKDSRISNSLTAVSKSYSAGTEKEKMEADLFVPESPEVLAQFISLRDRRSGKPYTLTDDGVIITEKFASSLDLRAGDEMIIEKDEATPVRVKIAAVTENYIQHYIYMTPALYEQTFGTAPEYTTMMITLNDKSQQTEDVLAEELLTHDEILGFAFIDAISENFADIMKSLDAVIVILIISAGALAFVVLYNLTNININERIREIATIKVLGFYDNEVSAYIYRENILLTLMGILFGLIFGVFLENYVITTAEVEMVMFLRTINPMSFVWAALITVLFSFIVNFVMHFHLKKVKMVESLKSVE